MALFPHYCGNCSGDAWQHTSFCLFSVKNILKNWTTKCTPGTLSKSSSIHFYGSLSQSCKVCHCDYTTCTYRSCETKTVKPQTQNEHIVGETGSIWMCTSVWMWRNFLLNENILDGKFIVEVVQICVMHNLYVAGKTECLELMMQRFRKESFFCVAVETLKILCKWKSFMLWLKTFDDILGMYRQMKGLVVASRKLARLKWNDVCMKGDA